MMPETVVRFENWRHGFEGFLVIDGTVVASASGVQGFLRLRTVVSSRWAVQLTVLEESRRSRAHDAGH
jgi:hypothetical protein